MSERRSVIIIGFSVVVAVGLVLYWSGAPSGQDTAQRGPLVEITDAAELHNHIQLTEIGMTTGQNFLGQRIQLVTGALTNVSASVPIRQADVRMVFTGYAGDVVHEYEGRAFESTARPLEPGAEYQFEIHFEDLPREWNHRAPMIEITRIAY